MLLLSRALQRYLPRLTRLGLAWNMLSELPESIWSATNLVSLDAQNNAIEYIPDEIGYLVSLETLKVRTVGRL